MSIVEDINTIGYWFQKAEANNIFPFPVTTLLFNFTYVKGKPVAAMNNGSIKSFNPKYNTFYKLLVSKDLNTAVCNLQSDNIRLQIISEVVIKCPEKINHWMI